MNVIKRLTNRYRYSWVVLKSLVKTDFKLRYQGSFLGVAWSVLKPLMLFCVMYLVFARFLHMTDGTSIYPVVLLLGISSWQFVNEAITVGLRSVVDRGDLLRKIHFPNYIVVVSATVGSLISLGINFVVVIIFAVMNRARFTWRVLFLPINVAELYLLTLGITLILATMYVYFRDVAHIWDVLQQVLFYATPIIYPLMTVQQLKGKVLGLDGETIGKLMLMNPIAQTIQDIRHNLIAPDSTPTVWNLIGNPLLKMVPLVLSLVLFVLGVYVFRKFNRKFAEVM